MRRMARQVLGPLVSGTTYRRWAYLILGGALVVPYALAGTVLVTLVRPDTVTGPAAVPWVPGTLGMVPAVVATGLIPLVRSLEATAATTLLGGPITQHRVDAARSWPTRWRTAGWFCAHLLVGFVVCLLTMILLTEAFLLASAPLIGDVISPSIVQLEAVYVRLGVLAPVAGAGVVVVLVYVVAGIGALMAATAPALLGPTAAERVAAAEERAAALAQRNRLARELHDSVGHALSVVTVQAGAAGRVLDSDPAFARRALDAISESARTALADLDHVLGLLREEQAPTAPLPSLADLDGLLERTRAAGVDVQVDVSGPLDEIPQALSRESYRIAQEGLTNVLRHAGAVPVLLRIVVGPEELRLEMSNELTGLGRSTVPAPGEGGGRGLEGIRERVASLHGEMSATDDGSRWRMRATMPLRPGL